MTTTIIGTDAELHALPVEDCFAQDRQLVFWIGDAGSGQIHRRLELLTQHPVEVRGLHHHTRNVPDRCHFFRTEDKRTASETEGQCRAHLNRTSFKAVALWKRKLPET